MPENERLDDSENNNDSNSQDNNLDFKGIIEALREENTSLKNSLKEATELIINSGRAENKPKEKTFDSMKEDII